jgi:hypothetical protein
MREIIVTLPAEVYPPTLADLVQDGLQADYPETMITVHLEPALAVRIWPEQPTRPDVILKVERITDAWADGCLEC